MGAYFQTKDLAVGHNGKILIRDICLAAEKGSILTLIGPNGGGKSTILRTVAQSIAALRGTVLLDGRELAGMREGELARRLAVLLTERVRPELMSAAEVAAMGRYPHTGVGGRLTVRDREAVREALRRVNALELAAQPFATLSDGQRQRVMLARALCQEPEVLVLDEPTAFLDIRHKLELLEILRELTHEQQLTVIMSMHEPDLAAKVSDLLVLVGKGEISAVGLPEDVLAGDAAAKLYGISVGSYNRLFGSAELRRPQGEPQVFVVAGAGCGIPHYRALQRRQKPFATGILFENDVDLQVALPLSAHVVTATAFEPMSEAQFEKAADLMRRCGAVIDAGTPVGTLNRMNARLLELARELELPVDCG